MHSPTSWETYKGTSFKSKNSTLIHGSHHCYSVSHDSRSKAIAESRKELMQTLQDLPESSFELSFQYLVQQQQVLQPVQNEAFIGKNSVNEAHFRKKDRKKKEKEKENNKPNQILRVEGMGNENFLLKMFFPSSLDWNKKAKVGNVPKLSPSFQESKEKRIKKSSPAGDNRSDSEDNTGESTNNSRKRSSKSRYLSNFLPQNLIYKGRSLEILHVNKNKFPVVYYKLMHILLPISPGMVVAISQ